MLALYAQKPCLELANSLAVGNYARQICTLHRALNGAAHGPIYAAAGLTYSTYKPASSVASGLRGDVAKLEQRGVGCGPSNQSCPLPPLLEPRHRVGLHVGVAFHRFDDAFFVAES